MSFPVEKALLPAPAQPPRPQSTRRRGLAVVLFACFALFVATHGSLYLDEYLPQETAAGCPQVDSLVPQRGAKLLGSIGDLIDTAEFKTKAINWLAGAVQVPTEVFDAMPPVGQDPRWEVFAPFHEYLLNEFPLVHSTLSLTKVNTYGLLFEWTGSDKTLKPVLLTGHQDVVPVEPTTYGEWTHPPFSGHFDGKFIWGRGSWDDKSGVIGIMSTIETLISQGFQPTRTFVLAFGFDEEVSGPQGAQSLAVAMESIYGDDAPFAFILDEGNGFGAQYGSVFALPAVAEKGYLDVHVEVTSPGGHSSVPPEHTTIGILAALVVQYENNPYKPELSRNSIPYSTIQCYGEHGATLPKGLRKLIKKSVSSTKALRALEKVLFEDKMIRSLVGTTQAIDIIQGGVKSNALPEQAYALVNHRISTQSSVGETMAHDAAVLKPLASKFNLTYNAFGALLSEDGAPAIGTLTLKAAYGRGLEPAPVSPISGDESTAYKLLSGTIKAAYNAHRSLTDPNSITVAPGMSTGNTDTKHYWKLSRNIFRYNHGNNMDTRTVFGGAHTVDETMSADAFLEMIRFFTTLILNADESTAI